MHWQSSFISTTDNYHIPLHCYPPPRSPKAIFHITHGMAEHSLRYAELAKVLTEQGMAVFAHDHRGHGAAVRPHRGHFADQQGWKKVCDDLGAALEHSARQHPDLPVFLLGHSMGSYIALGYLMHEPIPLAGCILSGSNYGSPWLFKLAKMIAQLDKLRIGSTTPSLIMDRLSFGAFNRPFKPNRTTFDWLSRDPAAVNQYIEDPLCGFPCSNQLWGDLLGGLLEITDPLKLSTVPDTPLLIVGGDCDPVSAPDGLIKLSKALVSSNLSDVTLKLYPQARHEIFNETNRTEVINDLINWLTLHKQWPRSRRQGAST